MKHRSYQHGELERYQLLYELIEDDKGVYYGVGILCNTAEEEKSSAVCYRVTKNKEQALELLDRLCRTKTLPSTLCDIVEDWMYEQKEAC